jgi:HKD family nuclease
MLIIRESFIAKPGQAGKLAKLMQEAQKTFGNTKCRIMTDLTGEFNQVVMVTEIESLAEFESRMQEYSKNTAAREKMKGYTDMYLTGERRIYQVLS